MPDIENTCPTRSKGGYKSSSFVKYFFSNTMKLWNSLPKDIQHKEFYEFKLSIKEKMKPKRYKYFAKGSKL